MDRPDEVEILFDGSSSFASKTPGSAARQMSVGKALSRQVSFGLSRQPSLLLKADGDKGEEAQGLPFEAVIHFTNSDAILNLSAPWKVNAPTTSTGTGFAIGNKRILTNCHVVHGNTSLRVFKHGVAGNFPARVLCESAVCDLALVTVDDETFWRGLPSVSFQEHVPNLDDTVCAVGYPLGATSVTLTRGVVSNVKLSDLSLTDMQEHQLTVQIDAAINPGNRCAGRRSAELSRAALQSPSFAAAASAAAPAAAASFAAAASAAVAAASFAVAASFAAAAACCSLSLSQSSALSSRALLPPSP